MIICTFGVYKSDAVKATSSAFKNNLLYAMIFVTLLCCGPDSGNRYHCCLSRASLVDLISAPMWVVYSFVILLVHVVLLFILSKIFKWDLCMVSTASLANIGGSACAPTLLRAGALIFYMGDFMNINDTLKYMNTGLP